MPSLPVSHRRLLDFARHDAAKLWVLACVGSRGGHSQWRNGVGISDRSRTAARLRGKYADPLLDEPR